MSPRPDHYYCTDNSDHGDGLRTCEGSGCTRQAEMVVHFNKRREVIDEEKNKTWIVADESVYCQKCFDAYWGGRDSSKFGFTAIEMKRYLELYGGGI